MTTRGHFRIVQNTRRVPTVVATVGGHGLVDRVILDACTCWSAGVRGHRSVQ